MTNGFAPLTSTPLGCAGYAEYAPCALLAPYVRCFWTAQSGQRLVNPDVCADILFTRDFTRRHSLSPLAALAYARENTPRDIRAANE